MQNQGWVMYRCEVGRKAFVIVALFHLGYSERNQYRHLPVIWVFVGMLGIIILLYTLIFNLGITDREKNVRVVHHLFEQFILCCDKLVDQYTREWPTTNMQKLLWKRSTNERHKEEDGGGIKIMYSEKLESRN